MTFSPLLTAAFSIETKADGLVILGAIVGILGELRLLVAILAFAALALALLARLIRLVVIPGPRLRAFSTKG